MFMKRTVMISESNASTVVEEGGQTLIIFSMFSSVLVIGKTLFQNSSSPVISI